jgi:hypothetical protein
LGRAIVLLFFVETYHPILPILLFADTPFEPQTLTTSSATDIGYQWQATLDIHLGHKIMIDGRNYITIPWRSDWEEWEGQSAHEFRVAVRWVIKVPCVVSYSTVSLSPPSLSPSLSH